MKRMVAVLAAVLVVGTGCADVVDGSQVTSGPSSTTGGTTGGSSGGSTSGSSGGSTSGAPTGSSSSTSSGFHQLSQKWITHIESGQDPQTLVGGASDGSRVYVSDLTGKVWALDATTGKIDWSSQVGQRTGTAVTVAGGKVFLYDTDEGLFVLDSATGHLLWRSKGFGIQDPLLPAVAGSTFIYSGEDGPSAVNVGTGAKVWARSGVFTAKPEQYFDDTQPVTDGHYVYLEAYPENNIESGPQTLVALSAVTGRTIWSVPVPHSDEVALTIAPGHVLRSVSGSDGSSGTVTEYDAATGKAGWTADIAAPYSNHESLVLGTRLLVPTTGRHWQAVDLATGKVTSFGDGGAEVGSCDGYPCVMDLSLYIYGPDGSKVQTIDIPKPEIIANLVTGPTGEVFLVGEGNVFRFE